MASDDLPDQGQPPQGLTAPSTVELSEDGSGSPQSRWQRVLVVVVVMALVAGVAALVLTRKGEPTPAEVLAEVRAFVRTERTATFTGVVEWTYAPKSGDIGHSSTARSRSTGEIRLPEEAHVVLEGGDFVEEFLIQGKDRFERSAETRAELAGEKWDKWGGFGPGPGRPGAPPAVLGSMGGPAAAALADAAGFASLIGSGVPLELDSLFGKLATPERLGPNRIRATVPMRDLVPEEVRKRVDELKAAAQEAAGSTTIGEDGGGGDGEDVEIDIDEELDWDFHEGTLTVTIDHGPDGRLDVLTFDTEQEHDDDRSRDHEQFRFANWGKPVALAAPPAEQVDRTPHIDEDALAEVQQQFTVLAPTALPSSLVLQSLVVQERDSETETCASVELTYAGEVTEAQALSDDEPPIVTVASVDPKCEWFGDSIPDPSDARTVRVGSWTARVTDDTEENYYSYLESGLTFVLEVNGTKVVAAGNLPEAQLVQVFRTLAPIDLSKQTISPGPFGE